ncbi:AraC family transcriptional regulator [Paenibacillus alginolyticus]|uniref:AraC family transcriptional regulator n=1 Tax=Paenibacillus alginolyticus TaxID=59839 RepID=A0ABT4G6L5_9BACL|nr:AraC family transcriptional regulator [Paenibacillus alginolyticus]MCY9691817.1 AraC family transcriptional regulator [Paenibacillus alginolyticus]MEC0143219.1 AraC family transcriptional regulator [Paenibacillus alginolyticus]
MDDKVTQHQQELALLIERFAEADGVHSTAIPLLHFIRASSKGEPIYSLHEPALCIVAQGSKLVMLAQENYQYDPSHYLVVSVDLPIAGQIIEASPHSPYLCLRLDFDRNLILDIISKSDQEWIKKGDSQRGLFVSKTNSLLLEAVLRLVRLLDTPKDIPVLAPLMIREIFYRVLNNEQGNRLKQIALLGSQTERIAKVISLIKQAFAEPLRIEQLATAVNMSASSLHHHFKEVTAMSPLQYQKQLRLQEARRLMLSESADAANAGFQVGYESPSQFSREYARMFGLPPISEIKRFRGN